MTRAALFPDPVMLGASAALAAVGINRLAVIAEQDPGGPLHQLGRAAHTELGPPEAVPSVALAAAVIGLGAIPRGQTKEERQIARALMAFRALLRAWDRYDQGRIAALRAKADQTQQRWATPSPVVIGTRAAQPRWAVRRERPAQR